MFFRRVFSRDSRKEHSDPQQTLIDGRINLTSANRAPLNNSTSPFRSMRRPSNASDDKQQRSLTVIQLTPLWEHIIRNKCLPENINEAEMFGEFVERLRDPEWQVRQHALKVLIDVLIVMRQRSDQYFQPLIQPLVENLGHSAPAIRKGALDVLKVYMTETLMPETVMLEIISCGMDQKKYFESFSGRICVGVMLSLPSLVYTSLGTAKQSYIVRAAINALTDKMIQVTYQEIALKVLLRIREMIGARDFSEYIAHGAYRDFELLCNVYGLPSTPDTHTDPSVDLYLPHSQAENNRVWNPQTSAESNCKVKRTELCWRDNNNDDISADDEENNNSISKTFNCNKSSAAVKSCHPTVISKKPDNEKVIMETEIQIEDTALTMRILEANSNSSENEVMNSEDDASSVFEHNALVRILTDSEMDELNGKAGDVIDSARNPLKRVTFGGEEVKLRTPDSDSVLQSDNDDAQKAIQKLVDPQTLANERKLSNASSSSEADGKSGNNFLSVKRPRTASIVITTSSPPMSDGDEQNKQARHKSASPAKRNRRPSFTSPEEMIISPKASHKGIEVLHNLQQRSPSVSPNRSRRNSTADKPSETQDVDKMLEGVQNSLEKMKKETNDIVVEEISSPEIHSNKDHVNAGERKMSWENLGLVDELCLRNIKSGDWRLRSNAMCTIEEMLKSTENLFLVQPHLESLFRTLLSSEKHPDVLEDKRRIIVNLISRLPLENLESRATQIILGLCRQGGSGSNRVAKSLMTRLPPTAVVMKLISDDFLKARSSRFRENSLQMVLYSLMTFPSTYFDISTCVKKSAEAANDRKKRVRQAALDVLAVLGQISSPKLVLDEVVETLKGENDSIRLIAAIKARLSRKQLPTVTPDGNVQYALRIPTPPQISANYYFGADIDWITAGIGSVSPVAVKKRFDTSQYNYSSSDSTGRSDSFRRMKDLSGYSMGSSSEYEYGNQSYGPNANLPVSFHKMTPRDDKNTHFVIATAIPANNVPYAFSGGGLQKSNMQSQSFPDLSRGGDIKNGPYLGVKANPYSSNKISKLPVASRFPSMESNIEARSMANNSNSKIDSPYYYSNANRPTVYSNTTSFITRQNGSLPRKFHTQFHTNTNAPNRNAFFTNYSHGAPDYQSSNDESRPSTHPVDPTLSLPKRFVNIDKYLEEGSSESNTPEKTSHDIRYTEQVKPLSGDSHKAQVDELNRKNDRITTTVLLNDHVLSPRGDKIDENANNNRVHSAVSQQDLGNESDNESSDDDDVSNIESVIHRPHSHASTATARSVPEEESENIVENRSKTVSSIGEEISTPKSDATTNENIDELSVIESEQIDNSLEHIQNENNEKLIVNDLENDQMETTGSEDVVDHADVRTEEVRVEGQPAEQLLDAPYVGDEKTSEIDDNEPKSDSDSRSLSSTEESSEYIATQVTTPKSIAIPIIIDDHKLIKPVPKLRLAIISRRNKISPGKGFATNAPLSAPTKAKAVEMFPQTLRKFDKPREASSNCLSQLDSQTWETTMNGLQSFVRLIRHHPEIVEQNLHTYCVALAKQVKNLRSQVSRSACQASTEFFQTHAKYLEQECEDLATQLFNRSADTNKFLRADASRALAAMVDNLPAGKVIQTLVTRGAAHQNAIVRCCAANLLSRMVSRLGADKVFTMHRESRDKLILAGANFLMEGSLDTRNNAKALFKQLSSHPHYNRTLMDVIPQRIYRNIEKALRSIK